MYLTDGYRIDPKMERDYLNHPLDNQGWLGRPAAAVSVAAADVYKRQVLGSPDVEYRQSNGSKTTVSIYGSDTLVDLLERCV